jgi:putative Holliday junction resolvase
MSAQARSFGARLADRYGIEVQYQDERLTSMDAERRFAELRAAGGARRKDAVRLDALAAKIILENWLESTGNE